jgi:tape measure domain-containing protein
VPDTVIRANLVAVGGEQMLSVLRSVRQEVATVAQQRARVTVDADTQQARRSIAQIRQETAELRAARYGITVTADTAPANRSIQAITLETQRLNALVARARVEVDTSQANRSLDETDKKLSGITDKIGRFALYGAGYALYGGISQAIGAAADAIVGFNSRLEQTRVAFTVALGSASAADQFIAQLKDFSQRTPFQFEDVTRLSQQLLGMSVAARDILPTMTAIGNAVAGVGGNTETLNRVVLAFGQINAAGKANAQDLRQLAEAGIPVYQMLAKALDTDVAGAMKRVSDGAVSSGQAIEALMTGINERFGGLMQAQSATLLGRLSNLKDAAQSELADIGKPLEEELGTVLDKVASGLQSQQFHAFASAIVGETETAVRAIEKIAEVLGHVPTGLVEWGLRLGEVAVGIKAVTAASSGIEAVLARSAAALGIETAAYRANAAAVGEDAAAKATAARSGIGQSALRAVGGTQAGTAVAGGLATAGELVAPVAATAVVIFVGASIAEQINKHIQEEGQRVHDEQVNRVLNVEVQTALNVPGLSGVASAYQGLNQQLIGLEKVRDALASSGNAAIASTANAIQSDIDRIKAAMRQVDPQALAQQAAQGLQNFTQQATASISGGHFATTDQIDAAARQAKAAIFGLNQEFVRAHGDLDDFIRLYVQFTDDIDAQTDAAKRRLVAQQQQNDALREQTAIIARQAQDVGLAPPADILAGLQGVDKGSADQIKLIQSRYADLARAQASAQQRIIEQAQQFAQDLRQATQQAQQAVQGVNLDQGLTALVSAAPGLEKARDALHAVGQESGSLNALSALADEWKAISDATDKASAAFRGYLLLYNETDQRIQKLEALKKSYDDAADAARAAQRRGEPLTADQRNLLANRPAVDANIDAQINQLRGRQAGDLMAAVKLAPDFASADQQMRDWVRAQGGAGDIELKVKALTEDADGEIEAFLDKPRQMVVNVVLNTDNIPTWARSFLTNAAGGAGDGGTAAAAYTDPRGRDLSRFNAGEGGDTGMARFTGGGGGWNSFQPLSQEQYGGIVASGPLANPRAYAAIITAARDAGVDPRALLAFMKMENNFGQDISASQIAGNNLAGIKFAHQPGATPGAISPEGDPYAKFDTLTNFFAALARNLTTEQYAADYQSGNLEAVRRRYVAGSATPTGAQQQNIDATISYYRQLATQYPAGNAWPNEVAGAANDLRTQIVQKALQSVGQDKLVNECERFVEETVEAITGRRGATGVREPTAAAALQSAQRQGLEVSKAQAQPGDLVYYGGTAGNPAGHVAIYMGDGRQVSTYDRGSVNDPQARKIHVEDVGAGAHYVRVPGLPDSAAPVPPAASRQPDSRFGVPAAGTTNFADPTTDAARAAVARQKKEEDDLKASILGVKAAQQDFNASLQGLDPKALTEVGQTYDKLLPLMRKAAEATLPDNADAAQKQTALNAATARTLDASTAVARVQRDIRTHSGDIAADIQKVADTVGGPLGQALATELHAYSDIQQSVERINQLTERKNALEREHTAILQQRQQADAADARQQTLTQRAEQDAATARERAHTRDQRRQEDAATARERAHALDQRRVDDARRAITRRQEDEAQAIHHAARLREVAHQQDVRNIEDARNAENDRWTATVRAQEDARRQLEFYGSEQKRQLDDALHALEDAHRAQVGGLDVRAQAASAATRGAGTNEGARAAAEQLAALRDQQAIADETFKKQADANKVAQDAEDRLAARRMYDLETQQLAETRAHEDRLRQIDQQSLSQGRAFEDESARLAAEDEQRQADHLAQQRRWEDEDIARQRSYEDESFRIQATQTAAARRYEDETARIQAAQLAESRRHEDERFAIEQVRAAEDQRYQTAQDALDKEIAAEKTLQDTANSALQAAQAALSAWDGVGPAIAGAIADGVAAGTSGAPSALPAESWQPGMNWRPRLAASGTPGMVSGWGIVGDAPSGDMSTAEAVYGNYLVVPHDESVRRGLIPAYAGGTVRPLLPAAPVGGDTYRTTHHWNVTIVQQPGEDGDALMRRLAAMLDERERTARLASVPARLDAYGAPRI